MKQELKKVNAAAAVTQMSVASMGGEEQGSAARGSPEGDGTGTAARKSEKVGVRRLSRAVNRDSCMLFRNSFCGGSNAQTRMHSIVISKVREATVSTVDAYVIAVAETWLVTTGDQALQVSLHSASWQDPGCNRVSFECVQTHSSH